MQLYNIINATVSHEQVMHKCIISPYKTSNGGGPRISRFSQALSYCSDRVSNEEVYVYPASVLQIIRMYTVY